MAANKKTTIDGKFIKQEVKILDQTISLSRKRKYVRTERSSGATLCGASPVPRMRQESRSWVRSSSKDTVFEHEASTDRKALGGREVLRNAAQSRLMHWSRCSNQSKGTSDSFFPNPTQVRQFSGTPRELSSSLDPSTKQKNVWKRSDSDGTPAENSVPPEESGGVAFKKCQPTSIERKNPFGRGKIVFGRHAPKRICIPVHTEVLEDEASALNSSSLSGNEENRATSHTTLTDFAYVSREGRNFRGGRGGRGRPTVSSMSLVRVKTESRATRAKYDAGVALCPSVVRGKQCKNPRCLLRHDAVAISSSTPICSFFERNGMCFRDGCPYRHVKVDSDAGICPRFAEKGYCEDSKCALRHVRVRKGRQYSVGNGA
uniref:C3H1-type domain-containing protein n=1 Tax=Corethron hystrix TaxID=216773 RepID=A0A7S1FZJ5_9STRA|mmetsp:Transcript_42766/g.100426  ORF Transcript_42766/g.100426 Transcript_42766/m.100426 type:complete len:374 (+) Transcript_42766:67-1188(+)|eukprot:CAMPEP_0113302928 /NCGR_PEP_ID=MMETSP0010_2-20120614/3555_1 /TAXON_ID=216773 ORGANISM="Corethron hystrix, Strain 308" /NCGR_SAMPLE_ID=MMETSP0010_2 /ASSEMBLY_ACC=CAM_ASM_000155 /LENGTH=373 /DNA_ID=CAMNT_0000156837 /DNA_START=31 /DNA_END=1152 /DNA_ORIENTATION=+ /assembly_acc=CAM_ASM_000155